MRRGKSLDFNFPKQKIIKKILKLNQNSKIQKIQKIQQIQQIQKFKTQNLPKKESSNRQGKDFPSTPNLAPWRAPY
jgi:hypothetical protein